MGSRVLTASLREGVSTAKAFQLGDGLVERLVGTYRAYYCEGPRTATIDADSGCLDRTCTFEFPNETYTVRVKVGYPRSAERTGALEVIISGPDNGVIIDGSENGRKLIDEAITYITSRQLLKLLTDEVYTRGNHQVCES